MIHQGCYFGKSQGGSGNQAPDLRRSQEQAPEGSTLHYAPGCLLAACDTG